MSAAPGGARGALRRHGGPGYEMSIEAPGHKPRPLRLRQDPRPLRLRKAEVLERAERLALDRKRVGADRDILAHLVVAEAD